MTKKERAQKLKEILLDQLAPRVDGGTLHIEVQALAKNALLVEILKDRGPGRQVFISVQVHEPDVLRRLYEALDEEAKPPF
jgi:hypothetical protein